jgi:hypothetical protein
MWPTGVVFLLPDSDDASSMVERIELVHPETFVTDFRIERLNQTVSPRLPWRDEDPFSFKSPVGNSVADELWTVIHAECVRGASLDGQQVELFG